ncbi:MAG: ATP-binding protein [bacterium]
MIQRHLDKALSTHFDRYKEAIILLGARQVGKTTILKRLFQGATYLTLDNESTRNILERYDVSAYQQLVIDTSNVLIVDEIQELSDPGRCAKIFYDQFPQIHLILTGSSALNIKNKTSESLAGRKIDYNIYPLTLSEYLVQTNLEKELSLSPIMDIIAGKNPQEIIRPYDYHAIIENILIYGQYPAMLTHPKRNLYLNNLVSSTIFKDLLELELLENKRAAHSLLKLLAHQIGNLINYAELATRLNIDSRTVKRYIELFEQSYIIFRLYPYSTNKRDEIGKSPKIYFHDLGVRNALVGDWSPLQSRGDAGALFENFVISELNKYLHYSQLDYNFNYWRTTNGAEVDLVISNPSQVVAIEIKSKARRVNQSFVIRYPGSRQIVITPENF